MAEEKKTIDIAVIGGGPAGLTAALYSARARCTTVVFEENKPGGQLNRATLIDNYPGFADGINGAELAGMMVKQAARFGATIHNERVDIIYQAEEKFMIGAGGEEFSARAVIAALGTEPRRKPVPGEGELTGRGVSYCATCDGFFFRDQDVAVIGNTRTAVKEALFLTRFCRKIYLLNPQAALALDDDALTEQVEQESKIEVRDASKVVAVNGKTSVSGVTVNSGGTEKQLPVKGVFFFTGKESRTKVLAELVERDEHGALMVQPDGTTPTKGLFAAGDVCHGSSHQVVTAAGAGARAALAAIRYLGALN